MSNAIETLNTHKVTQENTVELQAVTSQIQISVIMAKKFPRNIFDSRDRILRNCESKGMAESAIYSFPTGGKNVEGASIRLAEMMAQNYGNIQFGTRELEQTSQETKMEVWACDLETNFRASKIFTVKHERDKGKQKEKLYSNQDIYREVGNISARRLRVCILEVIPADITEAAILACKETLSSGVNKEAAIGKLLDTFKKLSIDQFMIEQYLNHSINLITFEEIEKLRGIYTSLKDGVSSIEDFFKVKETATDKLNRSLTAANKGEDSNGIK